MIIKIHDYYVLTCVVCGEQAKGNLANGNFETFEDAVEFAMENGWKPKNELDEFSNTCPDCQ